jgi:uncharacterized protein YdcH (DUF465 family)
MTEEQIAEILKRENVEYQKLSLEHKELKTLLDEINKKHYLTPEEEFEKKKKQKEKLLKKDRMAEMIRDYKKTHNN